MRKKYLGTKSEKKNIQGQNQKKNEKTKNNWLGAK